MKSVFMVVSDGDYPKGGSVIELYEVFSTREQAEEAARKELGTDGEWFDYEWWEIIELKVK